MNVDRLSNAWLYPAICHPVFSSSPIAGPFSAAVETFADNVSIAKPAKTIRQNAATLQRDGRSLCMLDSAPALLKKATAFRGTLLARLIAGNISLHRSSHAAKSLQSDLEDVKSWNRKARSGTCRQLALSARLLAPTGRLTYIGHFYSSAHTLPRSSAT
jgi:hypothetical protein